MIVSSAVRQQHVSTKSVALRNRHVRRVVSVLLIVAVFAVLYVWARVQVIQLGYEVTRLHSQVVGLENQHAQLNAEVARLKSPDRLEKIAREYFGMHPPRGREIVFVK